MKLLTLSTDNSKVIERLEKQLEAADEMAKAAWQHVHIQTMSHELCELCGLIEAYEKARKP